MKHISIGGLDVSRIGLGAMSMSGYYNIGAGSDAESIRAIHRALDLGVTQLDTGEVRNQADIARREGVTRARVTQVLGLLRLAPEIQETILAMPKVSCRPAITERALRSIVHYKFKINSKGIASNPQCFVQIAPLQCERNDQLVP